MNKAGRPVLFDAPTFPGLFRFRCEETAGSEIVRVSRDAHGALVCKMDGIERAASEWHRGLSRPRWQPFDEVQMLFQTDMVRAIREGRKTQTRRPADIPEGSEPWAAAGIYTPLRENAKGEEYAADDEFGVWGDGWDCIAPARPGDALWVRETWNIWEHCAGEPSRPYSRIPKEQGDGLLLYAETGGAGPWRPSIHMPRWAARTILDVTRVRCERAGSISCEDAAAEGFSLSPEDRDKGKLLCDVYTEWWAKQYPDSEWCWVYDFAVRK